MFLAPRERLLQLYAAEYFIEIERVQILPVLSAFRSDIGTLAAFGASRANANVTGQDKALAVMLVLLFLSQPSRCVLPEGKGGIDPRDEVPYFLPGDEPLEDD